MAVQHRFAAVGRVDQAHRCVRLGGCAGTSGSGVLGRIYEFFLGKFAGLEGKGGEFYTPRSAVKLLVEMVEPFHGKVYDPCCGSGEMFVQCEKFVEAHGGKGDHPGVRTGIQPTTLKLGKMNLAIAGSAATWAENADTLHSDLHPELRSEYIMANPPFNVSDWGGRS